MPTLLVIEDDADTRVLLGRLLTRAGFDVVLAADGHEGLARAHGELPDLVLTDLTLPGLNGWEMTQRLKSAHATRDIPVIALTAHLVGSDVFQARVSGCDEVLAKPVDLPTLLDTIRVCLDRRQPA